MLEYHTGFDMIPSASVNTSLKQMGWTYTDATAGTVSTTTVRTGTRAYAMQSGGIFAAIGGLAPAPTRVLGFGLYVSGLVGASRGFAGMGDGGSLDTPANVHIALALDPTGHLQVRRGTAVGSGGAAVGTLLATSTNTLVAATWCFVELVVTVHPSAGTVEVYVNGTKAGWHDLTGQNTQQGANAYSTIVGFGADAAVPNIFIDDLYTLVPTGAAPTTRLGDCKTVLKLAGTDVALGAGTYADSTPSTGTDRGANVDEPQPDDDTTYNALTAALQKDSYKTVALGQTGTIHAATVRARLKKADAGDGAAQLGLRSGTTDDLSFDVFPSDTSYQWFSRQYATNPATALPWTVAAIDSAQILVKRTL